jgi:hypothetical protein
VDAGSYQTFKLSADVILSASAGNGGLVFGYLVKDNYWLLLANKDTDDYELWQVYSGTFTKRRNGGTVGAGTHSLSVEVRSGSIERITGLNTYNATVPAGRVGVWAGSDSASAKFDDFKLLDMSVGVDIDGKWYDDVGDTALSSGKLRFGTAEDCEQHAIRRAFRGDKYVFEYDHPYDDAMTNGVILHYQDPENFMALVLEPTESLSYVIPKLIRRQAGVLSTIASGSTFAITTGDTVRCAIHDDPGTAALQELQVYLNGASKWTTLAIDDTWSAGRAGLIVLSGGSSTLDFDCHRAG